MYIYAAMCIAVWLLDSLPCCRVEPGLWDNVKGKILASMFILGRTWDLAVPLGNHPLLHFIEDQHSIQRELLSRPKASSESMDEELAQGLDDIGLLVKKLGPDSRSDDEQQQQQQFSIDQRCTRCDRRISTVSFPLSFVHAGSMLPCSRRACFDVVWMSPCKRRISWDHS